MDKLDKGFFVKHGLESFDRMEPIISDLIKSGKYTAMDLLTVLHQIYLALRLSSEQARQLVESILESTEHELSTDKAKSGVYQ